MSTEELQLHTRRVVQRGGLGCTIGPHFFRESLAVDLSGELGGTWFFACHGALFLQTKPGYMAAGWIREAGVNRVCLVASLVSPFVLHDFPSAR